MAFGHETFDVQRGYAVREVLGDYRLGQFDTDTDTDQVADDTLADKLLNSFLQPYRA